MEQRSEDYLSEFFSIDSELKETCPYWWADRLSYVKYLKAFDFKIQNLKTVMDFLFENESAIKTVRIYKRVKGTEDSYFDDIDFKNRQFAEIPFSILKGLNLPKILTKSTLAFCFDNKDIGLPNFFSQHKSPYIMGTPRTAYGVNARSFALKQSDKENTSCFLMNQWSSSGVTLSFVASKDSILNYYADAVSMALDYQDILVKAPEYHYWFKLVVKNKDIDRSRFKTIDDFWLEIEKEIRKMLKQKSLGYIDSVSYQSPKSSITLAFKNKHIVNGFTDYIDDFRNMGFPLSTTLQTSELPKNYVIACLRET